MSQDDLDALLSQLDDPSGLAWNEETYDLARARHLDARERAAYVERLLEHAEKGDRRAILTLGELDAAEAIAPLLKLSGAQGAAASFARRALVRLGRGQEVVSEIAGDALRGPSPTVRAAAVINLGRIGGAAAFAALDAALDDPDAVVRQLAYEGLVRLFGLERYTLGPRGTRELRTPLERMKLLIGSDLAALKQIGATELRDALQRLRSGATPDQAGLVWHETMPAPLRHGLGPALFDDTVALPVDDLLKVDGPDRRWAEALIAIALEREDPRAPDALARLAATWTLPALDAAATRATPGEPFHDAVEAARRTLRAAPN